MKIREQDVNRAVKDEEGRIFYVLPRSDGNGYYGATNRAGNPKEEQRALEMEAKQARSGGQAKEQVHSAVGPGRKSSGGMVGKLIKLVILLAILGALAWAITAGPLKKFIPSNTPAATNSPAPVSPASPSH